MNRQGVLPSQEIRELIQQRFITLVEPSSPDDTIDQDQIQPASLDLSLGTRIYRILGRPTPEELRHASLPSYSYLYDFELDGNGKILEKDCTYLNTANEQCTSLPSGVRGYANNKSSSGRINVQVKTTTLAGDDIITGNGNSPLYLRLTPKIFPLNVHQKDRFNQVRFIYGNAELDDLELQYRQGTSCFLYDVNGDPIPLDEKHLNDGLIAHLDLERDIVGYKAKKNATSVLDTLERNYERRHFWEEVRVDEHGRLLLENGEFYILSTKERISVPPEYAMEMVPYNLTAGEFRSHYAGFFDPGFGWKADGSLRGTAATLEVIPHENIYVRDSVVICKFKVERMRAVPDKIYEGHYQNQQGPQLAKFFRKIEP